MKIRNIHVFPGPSKYLRSPVVELNIENRVDLNSFHDGIALEIKERINHLSLFSNITLPNYRDDSIQTLVDIVLQIALTLQRDSGYDVNFAEAMQGSDKDIFIAVYEYRDTLQGVNAGRYAVDLVNTVLGSVNNALDPKSQKRMIKIFTERLSELKRTALGVPTRRLVWEAERRNIPWGRVHQTNRFIQLGQGYKQKSFFRGFTSRTSHQATILSTSKSIVNDLLQANGMPVPRQYLVTESDAAVDAARKIGFPVVIKPNFQDKGIGVSINLTDDDSVRQAFTEASKFGPVLVEEHVNGSDHRLTLINGRVVATGRNISTQITGNGKSTIQELIDEVNSDPRRGDHDYSQLKTIHVDSEILNTLSEQGCTLNSIPASGRNVALRRWWRKSRDHSSEDLTGSVHPDNIALVERAVRIIDLDLAGVDFISTDITRSWREVGGVINEINPTPGLNTHMRAGAPDIYRILFDELFPGGDNGRIPTVIITGLNGNPVIPDLVSKLLTIAGNKVGVATMNGVQINCLPVMEGDYATPAGWRMVLNDPLITAAIFEVTLNGYFKEGLGLDEVNVSVILDGDSMGNGATTERAAQLINRLTEITRDYLILDASDPASIDIASRYQADRICWVADNITWPMVSGHIHDGFSAVSVKDNRNDSMIQIWSQGKANDIFTKDMLLRRIGNVDHAAMKDILISVAITHCMGALSDETIESIRT